MKTLLHALLISATGCACAGAQQVEVAGGKVIGAPMADGSSIFYGIPYAAAPAGDLRWKPPAARAPWSGVLDATKVAPACPQGDTGWNKNFLATMQEDCLTVSIRTPVLAASATTQARLPVLVYLHGGSNAYAGVGDIAEDALHREGIVVVKLQYRLGAWGFLGLDALRAEDPHRSSGNYALLDQLAALKWIQANIATFGGDAGNVTISGNSAGALDALLLTLSPLSKGLFQKAIVQAAAPGAPRTAQQNEAIGNTLLDRLKLPRGAAGLARLRKLPTAAVDAAAANLPTPEGVDPSFIWEQQIIDGRVLKLPYAEAYAEGAGSDIRVIIGSNSQEMGADRKPDAVPALLAAAFGKQAPKAAALYRDDAALGDVPTQLLTDMWFRCPASWLSQRMANPARVWRYEFGWGAPGSGKPPEHTSEMDYVYRATPAKALPAHWPPVQRYWANFIRNGDPNGAGLPHWPAVAQGSAPATFEQAAYLDITPSGIAARKGPRAAQCKLMYQERDYPQSATVPN
ncbi:MAG TPA: carboxylesterase family protein [Duganella sp.]